MRSHWRESVFESELMTGWVDAGQNPLSVVTVSSLADMGYQVDVSSADPYTLPLAPLMAPEQPGIQQAGDLIIGPVFVVDDEGRLIRIGVSESANPNSRRRVR